MLHDSQTDMVFISRALDINHHRLYESLTDAFYEANVRYDVMPTQEFLCSVGIFESTVGILERRQNLKKIIWLRDYMPVTVDKHGGIEQFLCDSSPNMLLVCNQFGITPFQNDIKLDGSNILADKKGCVYMTDIVFEKNPDIPRDKLICNLKQSLNARTIIFIPRDESDKYGHVDRMMTIADDGTLITDLSWEYLNFLRVGNNIFVAQLGKPTDEPAIRRIQEAYPNCTIYPIKHAQSLTRLGGSLHRATWNTLQDGYRNSRVFKPSKRHPFNPFSADAFTEKRLRELVEYYIGNPLSNNEWNAFNRAFKRFWYSMVDIHGVDDHHNNLFKELVESMQCLLKGTPYFNGIAELQNICYHLSRYIINIPKLIIPWDTMFHEYEPQRPLQTFFIKFRDCEAKITSCILSKHLFIDDEAELKNMVEKEAKDAEKRNDGTVYILNYPCQWDYGKSRISHYRYELRACVDEKYHLKLVIYYDTTMGHLTLSQYAQRQCSIISFFDYCTPKPEIKTIVKYKAGCVWKLLGSCYTRVQLERYCTLYGITTDQALQWKNKWI